jgi:hypothetical protein
VGENIPDWSRLRDQRDQPDDSGHSSLPRRRHEIGEPIEKLKRRELDAAASPWPRGLSPAARVDPVGRLVSRDTLPGEPLQREGRPGGITQEVFDALEVARHVAVDERDPDARVD